MNEYEPGPFKNDVLEEKSLPEKNFIQENPSPSKFPVWLWFFLSVIAISLFWGIAGWVQSHLQLEIRSKPFLEVTNREFSVFLWQFPSFLRSNVKDKTGYLVGFQANGQETLNPASADSFVTGGGPGIMEVGNRVAKELQILSCANIVDFRQRDTSIMEEQKQNPYIEAKMTYRLDKLVERQAEFNLDFPIFLTGGIGTDFEFTLEEVRRKVGATPAHPIILIGEKTYWQSKITDRFKCNLATGTIRGSEWISNCFYCIQNAEQGLEVYRKFFTGTLPIGKNGPVYEEGFVQV